MGQNLLDKQFCVLIYNFLNRTFNACDCLASEISLRGGGGGLETVPI